MKPPSPDWCPGVPARIVEQVVGDELVLYDPASDRVHVLNTVAAAIFDLCDGHTPISAIIRELETTVTSPSFDLAEETHRLVATLLDEAILE